MIKYLIQARYKKLNKTTLRNSECRTVATAILFSFLHKTLSGSLTRTTNGTNYQTNSGKKKNSSRINMNMNLSHACIAIIQSPEYGTKLGMQQKYNIDGSKNVHVSHAYYMTPLSLTLCQNQTGHLQIWGSKGKQIQIGKNSIRKKQGHTRPSDKV